MGRCHPVDLAALDLPEVTQLLASLGAKPYHARQIFAWIYKRGATEFEAMTDLSLDLRLRLHEVATVRTPRLARRDVSGDGTTKYVLQLDDGRLVEAVYIPDTPAQTLCVSTQVGCAMQCRFCLTARMGLARNLTAGEIASQVRVLARDQHLLSTAFNVVLMGMGEPLLNYDATMKALRMLSTKAGLGLPARRVTLSTVGILPALERLAAEPLMPNLAVSLHASTDELREELVPVNRKYGLEDLIDACKRFPVARRDRITFEYVLLDGVNDTPADAGRLVKLLNGVRAKVNLMPLNEAPGIPYRRPADDRVNRFAQLLAEKGMVVTVRKSRGRDIRAACGQLIVGGAETSPAQRMAALIER